MIPDLFSAPAMPCAALTLPLRACSIAQLKAQYGDASFASDAQVATPSLDHAKRFSPSLLRFPYAKSSTAFLSP